MSMTGKRIVYTVSDPKTNNAERAFISVAEQIVHRVQMDQIESGLSLFGGEIRIWIIGIDSGLDIGAVSRDLAEAFIAYVAMCFLDKERRKCCRIIF